MAQGALLEHGTLCSQSLSTEFRVLCRFEAGEGIPAITNRCKMPHMNVATEKLPCSFGRVGHEILMQQCHGTSQTRGEQRRNSKHLGDAMPARL